MASGCRPKQVSRTMHNVASRYKQVSRKPSATSNVESLDCDEPNHPSSVSDVTLLSWKYNNADASLPEHAKDCTSTPSVKNIPAPMHDMSAIPANHSLYMPHIKPSLLSSTLSSQLKKNVKGKPPSVSVMQKDKRKLKSDASTRTYQAFNTEHIEMEIDVCYAQYLQSVFLESKGKRSLQLRCQYALTRIFKMWNLIQALMEKNQLENQGLDTLSYFIKLNKHLQKQEKVLQPVLEEAALLLSQYEKVAKAVDSVSHQLAMRDVLLPSHPSFEGDIVEFLQKLNILLNDFTTSEFQQENLASSSEQLSIFLNKSESVVKEIKRCSELLSTSCDLLLSETSLTIAAQQLNSNNG